MIGAQNIGKSLVILWASEYQKLYGIPYNVVWARDILRMKKLLDSYRVKEVKKLIHFVFNSNHKTCEYIQEKGHPLPLFAATINSIAAILLNKNKKKKKYFTSYELELRVPYWNDQRLVYLHKLIKRQDVEEMIDRIDEDTWDLYLEKVRLQDGEIQKIVLAVKLAWERKTPLRTPVVNNAI